MAVVNDYSTGTITGISVNKVTVTQPANSATLTIADGKTLTVNNTLTFTGTDSSSVAFGAGGTVLYSVPTASTTVLGLVKVDGSTITIDGTGVISAATSSPTFSSSIGTSSSSFDLINTGASTLNIGGAATTLTEGYTGTASSTTNITNGAVANGNTKTVNIGTGADASGATTTINVGTGGLAGSTTNVTLGSNAGTDNVTIAGSANTNNITLGNASGTNTITANGNIVAGTSSFDLINTGATTLNIGGAATTINDGYNGTSNSTLNISNGAVANGNTKTINLGTGGVAGSTTAINIGSTAGTDNVTIAGSANTNNITLGNASGTTTITANGSLVSGTSTFNLVNTGATTLNIGGAATTIVDGYTGTSSSSLSISNGAVASGNTKTVNIATGGATGSTTAVTIGSAAGTDNVTIGGSVNTNSITLGGTGATNTITLGSSSGTTAITANGSLTSGTSSFDLINTTAATVNFAGAATTLNDGYTGTATSTMNIANGAVANGNTKTINIGTGGVAGSTTNITLGSSTGTSTITIAGNLTVTGTTTTINSTTITSADKNLELGSTASPTDASGNGGGITVKALTDKTFQWDSTSNTWISNVGLTAATSLIPSTTTFALANTVATTLNIGGAATAVAIGASTGTTTVNNALAVNGSGITTTTSSFSIANTGATTLNIGGAATTLSIGASTGTTTVNNILSVSNFINAIMADTSIRISVQNNSATAARWPGFNGINYGSTFGGFPVVELQQSRGSLATPVSVSANDILGGFNTWGHNGTGFQSATRIQGYAESTFSTAIDAGLTFLTTAAGTQAERMRIDKNGNVGIGNPAGSDSAFQVNKPITSGTSEYMIRTYVTVPSNITGSHFSFNSTAYTAASAFTLSNYMHYGAGQSTIGSGSAITNQYGFWVDSNVIGATNNYGFYGNIPSGTNRYNLYMNGTADNYFAGNVGIGQTPTYKLQVQAATLTGTLGDQQIIARLGSSDASNISMLDISNFRDSTSSVGTNGTTSLNDWYTAGTRIQQKIDSTWMAWQQFNGTGNAQGIAWGTGNSTVSPQAVTEKMRLSSSGNLLIATTTDDGTNKLQVNGGLAVTGAITATGNITAYNSSDKKFKENLTKISNPLAKLNTISGYNFTWTDEYMETNKGNKLLRKEDVGIVAQELKEILPEAVHTRDDETLAVDYTKIIPLLIEAIKELQTEVALLKGL